MSGNEDTVEMLSPELCESIEELFSLQLNKSFKLQHTTDE